MDGLLMRHLVARCALLPRDCGKFMKLENRQIRWYQNNNFFFRDHDCSA